MAKEDNAYRDLLREGLQKQVENFVDGLNPLSAPAELFEMDRERLVANLTDFAIGKLRMFISGIIADSAYQLTTSVKWAKREYNEAQKRSKRKPN